MPPPIPTAARFVAAVAGLDQGVQHRLVEVSSLSKFEREVVLGALVTDMDVRNVCEVLLADWDRLSVAERTAMLLVLAEALASPGPVTGGQQ